MLIPPAVPAVCWYVVDQDLKQDLGIHNFGQYSNQESSPAGALQNYKFVAVVERVRPCHCVTHNWSCGHNTGLALTLLAAVVFHRREVERIPHPSACARSVHGGAPDPPGDGRPLGLNQPPFLLPTTNFDWTEPLA